MSTAAPNIEPSHGDPSAPAPPGAGVQSLHRALDLLEVIADRGGNLRLAEIAAVTGIPVPTTHRLMRTLVERGYLRQLRNRRYALGSRLVQLGAAANILAGANAEALLAELVDELGETANLAVLAGDHAEYVAQVPSRHAMRMFTEVGRRVELHCTGVGKALLSQLDDAQVSRTIQRVGLSAHTARTLTTETALRADLTRVRRDGYAFDEEEQELGVRCVAVPVTGDAMSFMALSVSGPLTRMTDDVVQRAVPLLHAAADRLIEEIAHRPKGRPDTDLALPGPHHAAHGSHPMD